MGYPVQIKFYFTLLNELTPGYNSVGHFVHAQVSHFGLTELFEPVYFNKDEHTVQRSTKNSVERERILKKRCSTILE